MSAVIDALIEVLATRVAEKLAEQQRPAQQRPASSRIPLTDEAVRACGAPSKRWVVEKAHTTGRPVIRGPRGARYVDATELDEVVASATIKRRARSAAPESGDDNGGYQ